MPTSVRYPNWNKWVKIYAELWLTWSCRSIDKKLYDNKLGDFGPPLEGLKKIYYNPRAFKILPFRHKWTQDGTTIESGFFLPYFLQSLNPEYMDSRGVCN